MLLQSGNGVDVERSVFPPRTHFVFGVLWMEMTTSTWMLVNGELCATSGNEFVLAFPPDQVHALKGESNGWENVIFIFDKVQHGRPCSSGLTCELSVLALFRKDSF
ncbi:hypothetical protein CDAR_1101 [Caerostris darwini]|uniref:AraC-type arabinose-binding/dimerisation domain-containing protein n=1 Tax=Caerostris darwini TaxID=1538125 RepID=A0AAV4SUL5_9ARAC|nr:hypothetical protein CDAR_911 [Caerostris darwini]GIY35305.1 hypothetical protein CDAR_1101 [Caerostris darwini]